MASIWLVLSDSDVVQGEGFHLTESSALARAKERRLEDRSIYEHSTQWLEISFEELRTLRGWPASYEVIEVEGSPSEADPVDEAWIVVEGGKVDADFGFAVTEGDALGMLLDRNIAVHEYWETSTARAEGVSFLEYSKDYSSGCRVRHIGRHGVKVLPSRA